MREMDVIMAEYLLKGGKMLAKTCPVCHAPLFEYKGERFCVVCAEDASQQGEPVPVAVVTPEKTVDMPQKSSATPSNPENSIMDAITILCRRMVDEPDPTRCLIYMQTIREGAHSIQILRQG
ncbi:MAG: Sjogren's syndrome/scleroderma autoantigen 1 family protein [Methanocalculus sp.]|nr:Sjogren's syndrome/scleroderma autoantigen 1 family protein [Methanocalculus sp.]